MDEEMGRRDGQGDGEEGWMRRWGGGMDEEMGRGMDEEMGRRDRCSDSRYCPQQSTACGFPNRVRNLHPQLHTHWDEWQSKEPKCA